MIAKQTLFTIPFVAETEDVFLEHIKERIRKEEKTFIITANPEIVMKVKEDEKFKNIVQKADFVTPDGIGVVKAAAYLGKPVAERITGCDMVLKLLQFADNEAKKVYFLGAADEVIEKAVEVVKEKYPLVDLCGYHNGFFSEQEGEEIAKEIEQLEPDMIFVALGSPKQEEYINKYLLKLKKGLLMGVGGSLDIISGTVKRAPNWVIASNLEWLYRIAGSPTRIKRSALPLMRFSLMTLREKKK